MKRARYSEEQIIGILSEHEAGGKCAEPAIRRVVAAYRASRSSPSPGTTARDRTPRVRASDQH